MSFTQLSLLSMHQVIPLVLVGCTTSEFGLHHHGSAHTEDMIACSLRRTLPSLVFVAYTPFRYAYVFFKHNQKIYPCALVQWFTPIGDDPCKDMGMWIVEPDLDHHGQCVTAIVHMDTAVHGTHLLPVYGSAFVPHDLHFSETLCTFHTYYINKYTNHHMHKIVF